MTETELTEEQINEMLDSQSGRLTAQDLTSDDLSTLTDFERLTMASLSSVLNAMTGAEYTVVRVEYTKAGTDELPELLGEDLVFGVTIDIGESFRHFIILEKPLARAVATALTGSRQANASELGKLEMSAVQEFVSQANGTYLANLEDALGIQATGEEVAQLDSSAASDEIGEFPLLGTLTLQSGTAASVQLRHLIPGRLGTTILSKVRPEAEPAVKPSRPTATPAAAPAPASQFQPPEPSTAEPVPPAVGVPLASSGNVVEPTAEFKPAPFPQLAPQAEPAETRNLDILMDVPLSVTVELGKTHVPIRQILEYGQGSLITLDKLAGEPIDLLVNGKYFARGEVVVIDENFGVRITSILSPAERIAQLS